MFNRAIGKLSIGSLDDLRLTVTAQYNPAQLELQRSVTWSALDGNNDSEAHRRDDVANDLEYKGGGGRSLSIELLFDAFEGDRTKREKLAKQMRDLDEMACSRDPRSTDHEERRPHQCVVTWGERGLPALRCVIESLSVKYTMFAGDGEPLRAVATIKVKEANVKLTRDAVR